MERYFSRILLTFYESYLKEHLSVAVFIYYNREASQWSTYFLGKYYYRKYLNVKIPLSKLFQGGYFLLVNVYWGSRHFPVNNYWGVLFSGEYLLTVTPVPLTEIKLLS